MPINGRVRRSGCCIHQIVGVLSANGACTVASCWGQTVMLGRIDLGGRMLVLARYSEQFEWHSSEQWWHPFTCRKYLQTFDAAIKARAQPVKARSVNQCKHKSMSNARRGGLPVRMRPYGRRRCIHVYGREHAA